MDVWLPGKSIGRRAVALQSVVVISICSFSFWTKRSSITEDEIFRIQAVYLFNCWSNMKLTINSRVKNKTHIGSFHQGLGHSIETTLETNLVHQLFINIQWSRIWSSDIRLKLLRLSNFKITKSMNWKYQQESMKTYRGLCRIRIVWNRRTERPHPFCCTCWRTRYLPAISLWRKELCWGLEWQHPKLDRIR